MSQGMKSIKDFAEEAKLLGGADLQELIGEVLNMHNVFSFGELLLVPSVQQVCSDYTLMDEAMHLISPQCYNATLLLVLVDSLAAGN